MSTCRHVAFFAVFVDVEPLPLDLRRNPQTDYSSHEGANDGAPHHSQRNCDDDRFQLLDPQPVTNYSRQAVLRGWIERAGSIQRKIWIYACRRKDAGKKRTECSTHCMNAKRIKRVV